MRKIYLTCAVVALALSANAQSSLNQSGKPHNGKVVKSNVHKRIPAPNTTRATQKFYLDYEYADQTRQDAESGITDWQRYIWDMNMRYTAADTFSQRYAVVDFYDGVVNSVIDSYGITDGSGYPVAYAYTTPLTLDSVFINAGHSNNSGVNDTLTFNIIQLNSTGYPTGTVLFTKSIISNVSMTGGTSWLQGAVIADALGYTVPIGTRFGIQVKYYGSDLDTFGLLAGFANNGQPCAANPTLPFFAVNSFYANNSYRIDIQYESYGLLPTSGGADTYYECDGASGYLNGGDSENSLQNWAVWLGVTNVTGVTNQSQLITDISQNMPNPFSTNSTINYSLAQSSEVTFTVTDLSGKVIYSNNYGKLSAGRQTIQLDAKNFANGIYYYTLTAGGSKATKKMVVAK